MPAAAHRKPLISRIQSVSLLSIQYMKVPLNAWLDQLYRPGNWPACMAAFCSWNRDPSRSEPFRYLSTHRSTQPASLEIKDLVVKSLTQSSKHRWTNLEYIWENYKESVKVMLQLKRQRARSRLWSRDSGLTVMNSFICFFSIRLESSRCSAALRLRPG